MVLPLSRITTLSNIFPDLTDAGYVLPLSRITTLSNQHERMGPAPEVLPLSRITTLSNPLRCLHSSGWVLPLSRITTLSNASADVFINGKFYHYQESQHSQTDLQPGEFYALFYHYQESQHSQTSNCIFMQQFSASVSAYTRRRGS